MNDCDRFFVGRHVLVEIDDYVIPGKLLSYHEGSGNVKPHAPTLIVLETSGGKAIVRGNFLAIKSFGRVS